MVDRGGREPPKGKGRAAGLGVEARGVQGGGNLGALVIDKHELERGKGGARGAGGKPKVGSWACPAEGYLRRMGGEKQREKEAKGEDRRGETARSIRETPT